MLNPLNGPLPPLWIPCCASAFICAPSHWSPTGPPPPAWPPTVPWLPFTALWPLTPDPLGAAHLPPTLPFSTLQVPTV